MTGPAKQGANAPNVMQMRPGVGGGPGGGHPGMRKREKPKNMWRTFKRLLAYLEKSRYFLYGLLAVMLISTGMSLVTPMLQGEAINAVLYRNGESTEQTVLSLLFILALMGIAYVVSAVFSYFQGIFSAKLSQKTVHNMREDLFAKISYLPIGYTDRHRHGDIMSRMTNDVENISNTVSQSIASLFSALITVVGVIVIMFSLSWRLALVAMITIPLSMGASVVMAKFMQKYFVRQQKLLGALNGHVEESVTGFRTVLAYGKEEATIEKFNDVSDRLCKTGILANIFGGIMGPLMNVIGNIGFLSIAVAGGYMAFEGAILVGTIQTFLNYSKQFTRPINEIANQYANILTALAGAERVFEMMDAESELDQTGETLDREAVRGELVFSDISFAYKQGEPVLSGFSLAVKPGQKIAIVGRTGSGKTTIVNLLNRFYEIDNGAILLDGVDIRTYTRHSLRSAIAIVLQDTVLFSDTIDANIRYGRQDATKEAVRAAAETANAHVFIERLPDGYHTKLTESGGNLSQGQRQLLSIARAVLADPKILILDEATSSVDTRTEMQIQEAMLSLMQGRTSLIIAHRLSTIRDADKIIVLDDGRVAEIGTHSELLAARGAYFNLYQTQFAGIAT